jgi:hypothetical protein
MTPMMLIELIKTPKAAGLMRKAGKSHDASAGISNWTIGAMMLAK